jgi:hypothetical protein
MVFGWVGWRNHHWRYQRVFVCNFLEKTQVIEGIKPEGGVIMRSLPESLNIYHEQLQNGAIQEAYKGLMEYILSLKTQFKNRHPEFAVSSNIYFGYLDMTYFSILPEALKKRGLKVAIVFLHKEFRFEVWLAGVNKEVQADYWKRISESGWKKYHLVPTLKGADSILEDVLVENPGFDDLDALTNQIEQETLRFIHEVEGFLLKGII